MGTRQERKERITEQRRRQILDAALSVFSRKGYGEATIPDIAQEAGIAVGTIYIYYENKRDLLLSLFNHYVFNETFTKLMEYTPDKDDRSFLYSLILDRVNFGFDNMERFGFLLTEVQRDPDLRRQYAREVIQPLLKKMEKYYETRVTSGVFRSLDMDVIVRALGGMMIGFLILSRIEGEEGPCRRIPREDVAEKITDLALNGLRADRS